MMELFSVKDKVIIITGASDAPSPYNFGKKDK